MDKLRSTLNWKSHSEKKKEKEKNNHKAVLPYTLLSTSSFLVLAEQVLGSLRSALWESACAFLVET